MTCRQAAGGHGWYPGGAERRQGRCLGCVGSHELRAMKNSPDVTATSILGADPAMRLAAAWLWLLSIGPSTSYLRLPAYASPSRNADPAIRGRGKSPLSFTKIHPFVETLRGRSLNSAVSFGVLHSFGGTGHQCSETVQGGHRPPTRDGAGRASAFGWRAPGGNASSPAAAASYLDHPAADLRRAALKVLYRYWRSEHDVRGTCMRLLRNDQEIDVRIEAENVLGAVCHWTDDPEVGRVLAGIVRATRSLRSYDNGRHLRLFSLRAMPVRRILDVASRTFRFPEDVDWDFVDSFIPDA